MKAIIQGFSQQKIVDYGITSAEVDLLEWLHKYNRSGKQDVIQYNNKNYYWVKVSKILKDLPILNVENRRVEQIIDKLCKIEILEKCPLTKNSRKLYLHFYYDKLLDTMDDKYTDVMGIDTALRFYSGNTPANGLIRYNAFKLVYQSAAISEEIIKRNLTAFTNEFKNSFKQISSTTIYEMLTKKLKINFANDLELNYELTMGVLESNIYKVERALVDAYIAILKRDKVKAYAPKVENAEPSGQNKVVSFIPDKEIYSGER